MGDSSDIGTSTNIAGPVTGRVPYFGVGDTDIQINRSVQKGTGATSVAYRESANMIRRSDRYP